MTGTTRALAGSVRIRVLLPLRPPLVLPERPEPDEEPSALPDVVPEAAWLSGMQSMCTGLELCSLALPVSLSASCDRGRPESERIAATTSAVVRMPSPGMSRWSQRA